MKHPKSSPSDAKVNEERRTFLKGVTTVAVASALGTTAAHANSDELTSQNSDDKNTVYRETQHIKDYYDSL
ncbi:twin-arginine translocation signal domain-containing protein [Vibrio hippocampi]|uniref:Transcriptional initiation protein Tat n=1 Tax=Vibrio hippocampi TaxID=654686 RepID=A0ABM8ZH03_9VIBR|nr:twin-arginine translocation signal domain-containing protein [Vibrio hippocampi]CAH0525964.1 hypothetical protein VHP8226_01446 [Vibrio hippocampi]